MLFHIENWFWKSDVGTFWRLSTKHNIIFISIIIFFWECWFLAKNLTNFDPLTLINEWMIQNWANFYLTGVSFLSFDISIVYKFNQYNEFWNWHLWAKFRPHYFVLVNIPKQCPLVAVELDRRVPDFHGLSYFHNHK